MLRFDPKVRVVSNDMQAVDSPAVQKPALEAPPTTQVPVEQARVTHGTSASPSASVEVRAMPTWVDELSNGAVQRMLGEYVQKQRWFGGKARELTGVQIDRREPLPAPKGQEMFLAVVRADYAEGAPERYVMLLSAAKGSRAGQIARQHADAVIGQVRNGGSQVLLYDAMRTEDGTRSLLELIQNGATSGNVVGDPTRAWKTIDVDTVPLGIGSKEQSNTSVRVGQDYMIKLLRRMSEGVNPDVEVGRFLTDETSFDRVPALAGAVELADGTTIAMVQALVKNAKDAWELTLDEIRAHLDGKAPKEKFAELAATLGRRTGELHLALRGEAAEKNAAFAPERLTQDDLHALADRMRGNLDRVLEVLSEKRDRLDPNARDMAERLLAGKDELLRRIDALTSNVPDGAIKTRVHGDYHLGQVLADHTGKDFFIIDFEGEPTRSLEERRAKAAPEKDVAGMLRSFDYAGRAGLGDSNDPAKAEAAREWASTMQRAFLDGYLAAVGAKEASPLLEAYVLDKAIYELDYELNNRTAWAGIPLGALVGSLG